MKNILTRSIAVILSVITVFGCLSFSGFASDEALLEGNEEIIQNEDANTENNEETGEPENPETPENPENPENPEIPEEPKYKEDTVALIYLCSNDSGFPSLGHIWAYFENVSEETIMVGVYPLPAGEGVSVGLFGLTRDDGFGLHYNVESYTFNRFAKDPDPKKQKKVKNAIYLCAELNSERMAKISNRIRNINWWDPIIFNCVTFAVSTWNMAGAGFIFPWTVFPGITRGNIRLRHAEGGLEMFDPPRDKVWKQIGRGKNASWKICKDGTVDTPPG